LFRFQPFADLSALNRHSQRITAFLLLGAYGLAVAVSGAFHTHSGSAYRPSAPSHAELGHEFSCPAHHRRDPAGRSVQDGRSGVQIADARSRGINSRGDACVVCLFLANKPVPTTSRVEVAREYAALLRLKAIPRVESPFSAIWSRGPPAVA
jgi:hypothetical protein